MNRLAPTLLRLAAGWLCLLACAASAVSAAEVIPEVPTRYFNDYALLTKPETTDRLNQELEDFERQTSNQLRVAIFPKLQTDSSLEDYTQRVARAWQVGEKDRRNGAILFVFVQDHKLRIEVGYGLEGALPDATAKDIIADRISPKFKAGDFDGGLTVGVEAMMQAVKGEYKGSGRTHYEQTHNGSSAAGGGGVSGWVVLLIIAIVLFSVLNRRRRGTVFSGAGPTFYGGGLGGGFGGGGFGGWSSGGGDSSSSSSSSSNGGGFASSGGGDFGGGGASGDW